MIGYKLLRDDLSSLNDEYGRVTYGPDWQEVQGNGAYLGLTIPGLLLGGYGPVLAEVEGEEPTGAVEDGQVVTVRRVRVLLTARTIVYGIMLLTDSAHRAAWREIRNDR